MGRVFGHVNTNYLCIRNNNSTSHILHSHGKNEIYSLPGGGKNYILIGTIILMCMVGGSGSQLVMRSNYGLGIILYTVLNFAAAVLTIDVLWKFALGLGSIDEAASKTVKLLDIGYGIIMVIGLCVMFMIEKRLPLALCIVVLVVFLLTAFFYLKLAFRLYRGYTGGLGKLGTSMLILPCLVIVEVVAMCIIFFSNPKSMTGGTLIAVSFINPIIFYWLFIGRICRLLD